MRYIIFASALAIITFSAAYYYSTDNGPLSPTLKDYSGSPRDYSGSEDQSLNSGNPQTNKSSLLEKREDTTSNWTPETFNDLMKSSEALRWKAYYDHIDWFSA